MLKKCPDCGGELEKGYIADFSYGAILPQKYTTSEYSPPSIWAPYGMFKSLRNFRNVFAYRCKKCSRIFHYSEEKEFNFGEIRKKAVGQVLLVFAIVMLFSIGVVSIVTVILEYR